MRLDDKCSWVPIFKVGPSGDVKQFTGEGAIAHIRELLGGQHVMVIVNTPGCGEHAAINNKRTTANLEMIKLFTEAENNFCQYNVKLGKQKPHVISEFGLCTSAAKVSSASGNLYK